MKRNANGVQFLRAFECREESGAVSCGADVISPVCANDKLASPRKRDSRIHGMHMRVRGAFAAFAQALQGWAMELISGRMKVSNRFLSPSQQR